MYLKKNNIIKQIGSSPQDKPVYGTTYLNPLIIIPKGDTIKCVLAARHLNSNTEQSDEYWPIEPLAPQLARANKKYKSAIDLMYAYAHTHMSSAQSTSTLNLLKNYILFLNCFTIYMRTLHGNGQMNTNVFFKK